jgi:inhibitor of KinA
MQNAFTLSILSEKSISVFLNKEISLSSHSEVLRIKKTIEAQDWPWLLETVPSYNSVSIFVDISFYYSHNSLISFFEDWFSKKSIFDKSPSLDHNLFKEIPVKYEGADLLYVSNYCQMPVDELIQLHSRTTYTVAMIGFLPGFPYLLGMDPRLFVPRKSSPRLKVTKGSVGIGGLQTGIYPSESPGGWQIIGTTPLELFDLEQLNYLSVGDKVKFKPI